MQPTGTAPQFPGPGVVDALAFDTDRNTIVAFGSAARDHTVAHVAQDGIRRASERIAPAAASRRVGDDAGGGQPAHAVFGRHEGGAAFRLDRLQADATVLAAFDAE